MSKQVSRIVSVGLALAGLVSLSQAQQQACVPALSDNANTQNCIPASTTPTMGMLYPLSTDLFMDPITGYIGLGMTSPQTRLHVAGSASLNGDLRLNDVYDGIQFSSDPGSLILFPTGMLTMFEDGFSNPHRMVISHSPGTFQDYGLEYEDNVDAFKFQRDIFSPVFTVGLQAGTVTVESGSTLIVEAGDVDVLSGDVDILSGDLDIIFGDIDMNDGRVNVSNNANAALFASTTLGLGQPVVQMNGPTGGIYSLILAGRPGANDTEFRVAHNGSVFSDGSFTGPADFAEMIQVSSGALTVEPGDLVEIDPLNPRSVRLTTKPRSSLVMGVYSTKPGFVGSEREWDEPDPQGADLPLHLTRADMAERFDEVPVAVVGIVPVKASAENGPIAPGDLLVSSSLPGHVMRDTKPQAGTIVGKALGALNAKTGVIRILVTLQ